MLTDEQKLVPSSLQQAAQALLDAMARMGLDSPMLTVTPEADALRAALAEPVAPAVAEAIGYITPYSLSMLQGLQGGWRSEITCKITKLAQPDYEFTVPVYAALAKKEQP